MTSSQKTRLLEMRQAGESFTQISAALGISINTLKSVCRRAHANTAVAEATLCAHCGDSIKIIGRRRFCSNRCRYAWNYSHRNLGVHNSDQKKCACCGGRFFSYASSQRKYCSRACYIADRYGKADRHDEHAV